MVEKKKAKLIVLLAFDLDSEGNLRPAFEPREMPSEDRARLAAMELAPHHAGILAWSRTADPQLGEYGEPVELARYGLVPDME
jgi:hypothetical protein